MNAAGTASKKSDDDEADRDDAAPDTTTGRATAGYVRDAGAGCRLRRSSLGARDSRNLHWRGTCQGSLGQRARLVRGSSPRGAVDGATAHHGPTIARNANAGRGIWEPMLGGIWSSEVQTHLDQPIPSRREGLREEQQWIVAVRRLRHGMSGIGERRCGRELTTAPLARINFLSGLVSDQNGFPVLVPTRGRRRRNGGPDEGLVVDASGGNLVLVLVAEPDVSDGIRISVRQRALSDRRSREGRRDDRRYEG